MSRKFDTAVVAVGIDPGKNILHLVGLDARGEIVLREKVARAKIVSRLANMPPCLIGIEAVRVGARVVICRRISQTASGELYGVRNLGLLIGKRARIQGLGVPDFADRYPEARAWLAAQAKAGRLRQHVHVIEGLEQAPVGLGMLFRGENNGKLAVRVAE